MASSLSPSLPTLLQTHASTPDSLSAATTHLQSLLDSPLPLTANTLALAGRTAAHHYSAFLASHDSAHLSAAIALLNAACAHAVVPDLDPALAAQIATDRSAYLTVRYGLTGDQADFDDAVVLLRARVVGGDGRGQATRWNLWKCLETRWRRGGGREEREMREAVAVGHMVLKDGEDEGLAGDLEAGDREEVVEVLEQMLKECAARGFGGDGS